MPKMEIENPRNTLEEFEDVIKLIKENKVFFQDLIVNP